MVINLIDEENEIKENYVIKNKFNIYFSIIGNLNIWVNSKNFYFINKICIILGFSSLPITIYVFISYLLTGV
jgi:hypothetical protein